MTIKMLGVAALSFVLLSFQNIPLESEAKEVYNPEFRVKIEFLIDEKELEKYPEIFFEFFRAVETWRVSTPIYPTYGKIDRYDPESYTYFKCIKINVVEKDEVSEMPSNYIGMINPRTKMLYLSHTIAEAKIRSYNTALHELGHMFGLPHIFSKTEVDSASSGQWISESRDVREMLMYFTDTEELKDVERKLSEFEINLARELIPLKFGAIH